MEMAVAGAQAVANLWERLLQALLRLWRGQDPKEEDVMMPMTINDVPTCHDGNEDLGAIQQESKPLLPPLPSSPARVSLITDQKSMESVVVAIILPSPVISMSIQDDADVDPQSPSKMLQNIITTPVSLSKSPMVVDTRKEAFLPPSISEVKNNRGLPRPSFPLGMMDWKTSPVSSSSIKTTPCLNRKVVEPMVMASTPSPAFSTVAAIKNDEQQLGHPRKSMEGVVPAPVSPPRPSMLLGTGKDLPLQCIIEVKNNRGVPPPSSSLDIMAQKTAPVSSSSSTIPWSDKKGMVSVVMASAPPLMLPIANKGNVHLETELPVKPVKDMLLPSVSCQKASLGCTLKIEDDAVVVLPSSPPRNMDQTIIASPLQGKHILCLGKACDRASSSPIPSVPTTTTMSPPPVKSKPVGVMCLSPSGTASPATSLPPRCVASPRPHATPASSSWRAPSSPSPFPVGPSAPIVIDIGSGRCKSGLSTGLLPQSVLPSVVGRIKKGIYVDVMPSHDDDKEKVLIGSEMEQKRGSLDLKYPIQHGVVNEWADLESIWRHIFNNELRVDPKEHPVLLTQPPLNPVENRERMVKIMFETFEVPSLYIKMQAPLALLSTGRMTGCVLDSGDGVTHLVPVYEGYGVEHAIKRLNFGGRDLTHYMIRLLQQQQGYSLTTSAEFQIARDLKERLCYVALGHGEERVKEDYYTLPDGNIITVGTERFECPELLFEPSVIGKEMDGIHTQVKEVIGKCDIDIQKDLYKNILLSGGSTLFPGTAERLRHEVQALVPTSIKPTVNVQATGEFSVWQGGAVFASHSSFHTLCIRKDKYYEVGPSIVHQKCF